MKQRLISAGVALPILAIVLFCYETFVFNLVISVLSFIAVYEMLMATKYIENKALAVICLSYTAIFPFTSHPIISPFTDTIILVFALTLFIFLLANHKKIKIEEVALSGVVSFLITASFSVSIYMRNNFGTFVGLFYLCIALGSAWFSDAGAYFAGMFFGKHKLAPNISPKKTIEGAIGGVISNIIFMSLYGLLYTFIIGKFFDTVIEIDYIKMIIFLPFISVSGILGDLSASIVKRQCMIKDFGNIMPGHGGVLDRFDSVLFTIPITYYIVKYFPVAFLGWF